MGYESTGYGRTPPISYSKLRLENCHGGRAMPRRSTQPHGARRLYFTGVDMSTFIRYRNVTSIDY